MANNISNNSQTNAMKLIFNGTSWANFSDVSAVGPATFLFVALHTADPTNAGTQASSEITYTGYTRVAVARTSGAFAITGTSPASCSPVAAITFPPGTGGSGTATFATVGLGKVSGAAGSITCTSAAPGVFTWTAHALTAGMQFYFTGTAPTGLTASTVYYVSAGGNLAANTFAVSSTYALALASTSITTTGTGANLIGFGGGTATDILWNGAVSPTIVTGNGVTPQLTTASAWTLD
jgi:hypothetical protein